LADKWLPLSLLEFELEPLFIPLLPEDTPELDLTVAVAAAAVAVTVTVLMLTLTAGQAALAGAARATRAESDKVTKI
jgi:predicted branched-subunit amino acid permease